MLRRARRAQARVANWTQKRADEAVAAAGWAAYREDDARAVTELAAKETGMGRAGHQLERHRTRILGTLRDMDGARTVGVVERDRRLGLVKIAKPVGVAVVLTPTTSPTASVAVHALTALKTRNAAIVCPNPRSRRSSARMVEHLRRALRRIDAPEDLLQAAARPSRALADKLMAGADLVIATGGAAAVRRAATSGIPAYGAGAGNATVVVDETADVEAAARLIAAGKSFDHGTSCSSESCLVVHGSVCRELLSALGRHGGHLVSGDDRLKLRKALRPGGRALDRALAGRSAPVVAAAAGVEAPPDVRFLIVEGGEPEPGNAFCLEKLCPVLALWSYDDFAQAIERVNRLTDLGGPGHSCGIHTRSDDRVRALAEGCRTSRLLVNQSLGLANSGSFNNGMPFSVVLTCGTWGGSVSCENLTWRHWLNITWVSEPVERREPVPEDFFAEHWQRHGR